MCPSRFRANLCTGPDWLLRNPISPTVFVVGVVVVVVVVVGGMLLVVGVVVVDVLVVVASWLGG